MPRGSLWSVFKSCVFSNRILLGWKGIQSGKVPSPFQAHLKFTAESALELIEMTHCFTDLKLLSPVQLTQHLSSLGVVCPQPKRQPPRWHCSTAEASPSSVTAAASVPTPCHLGLRPCSSLHSPAGACTEGGWMGWGFPVGTAGVVQVGMWQVWGRWHLFPCIFCQTDFHKFYVETVSAEPAPYL